MTSAQIHNHTKVKTANTHDTDTTSQMEVDKFNAKRSASDQTTDTHTNPKKSAPNKESKTQIDRPIVVAMTSTQNAFAPLSDIDDEFIEVLRRKNNTRKQQISTPITHNTRQTSNTQNNNENAGAGKRKMPPINIFEQNIKDIINVIKNTCKVTEFNIKKITNNKHAIYTYTINDFQNINNKLKMGQVPSYTYTPKCLKSQSFILKGLDKEDNINEIVADIKKHENETLKIEKVTQFNTKNVGTSFFIVSISNNSAVKSLLNIKYVLYRAVRWERIRRDGITQCYRCQRFGHTAVNCNLQFRCVKCSEEHQPGECKLKAGESERETLFCVHCGVTGHPASYRGCPKYKDLMLRLNNRKNEAEQRTRTPTTFVNNTQSFASLFKTPNTTNNVGNTTSNVSGTSGQKPTDYNDMRNEFMEALKSIQQTINQQMMQFGLILKMIEDQNKVINAIRSFVQMP